MSGGAIFNNLQCRLNLGVLCDSLRECVVCRVSNTDIIISALYILPVNSIYYNDICMTNLEVIYRKFRDYNLLIIGDLNSRIGTPAHSKVNHSLNPDININSNGRKILQLISKNQELVVPNGLLHEKKKFDSNFTYFRGNLKSQNDLALSNNIDTINTFEILPKMIYSDHCPISISYTIPLRISMDIVHDCSKGCFD